MLAGIMRSKDATPAARVSAANAILDRGWGKVAQPQGGDGEAVTMIHRIERVIVHADDAAEKDQRDGCAQGGAADDGHDLF